MTIFLSYSHKDEVMCKRLEGVLRLQETVAGKLWRDDQILPGSNWDAEIARQLQNSEIIALLLSRSFLESDYIPEKELGPALARHEANTARVVPIILSECKWKEWQKGRIGALQALPSGSVAIAKWSNETEAMVNVAQGLRRVAEDISNPSMSRSFTGLLDACRKYPEIKTVVMNCLDEFRTGGNQRAVVADYKAAHEILQTIQFQCFQPLRSLAPRFPDDASAVTDAEKYEVTLQANADALGAVATARPEPDLQTAHLYVQKARMLLRTALEKNDRQSLDHSLGLLGPALAQFPPPIAAKLDTAASALHLPGVARALFSVAERIKEIGGQSAEISAVESGAEGLLAIDARLTALTSEHKRWQAIDSQIRISEAALARDPLEFAIIWPTLRASLFQISSGVNADWAIGIADDLPAMDAAIDDKTTRRPFARIQQRSDDRFFRVDGDLKQLAESVRTIEDRIKKLLHSLLNGNGTQN